MIKTTEELIAYCASNEDWFLKYAASTVQEKDERD